MKSFIDSTIKPLISKSILIVCISISLASYAAQPRITKSQLSDWLEQSNITAIRRDRNGFLWIGTQQGLHRFDGNSMTTFNSNKSNPNRIPASEITDITEDLEGNILVATFGGGILRWNPTSKLFDSITEHNNKKHTHFTRILASRLGHIWLGTKNGVILYTPDPNSSPQETPFQKDLKIIGRPHFFLEDKAGKLLVGSNLGLFIVSLKHRTVTEVNVSYPGLPEDFGVTALELDNTGNLYIGTNTGHLVLLDLESRAVLSHSTINSGQSGYISDVLLYEDKLLVATDSGLFFSNLNFSATEELSKRSTEPFNSNITNLYYDNRHIWVGTYQGLNILSFTPFDIFNERNSSVSDDVTSIEEDSSGNIWVGTYSGLFLYRESLKYHIKHDSQFSSAPLVDERVSSISRKGDEMWLGFYNGGVQVIDSITGSTRVPLLPSINQFLVTKILASKKSGDIWIATYDHGLFRITPDETHEYLRTDRLQEKSVTQLFETHAGDLLIATVNKIHLYSSAKDSFETLDFDFKTGAVSPTVLSFGQSRDGNIWIGTKDNGLFVWTKTNQLHGRAVVHSPKQTNSFNFSTIYAIEVDDQENLWCSTQNGLVKLDKSGKFSGRFTTIDGLQGNDFELGSSYQSNSGYLYFGGPNGYNRFHPKNVVLDKSPSPVRLTGIRIPREIGRALIDASNVTSIQLTHKDHFITFEFSVLDFIDPHSNQYRYKLEEFDPEWVENGTRNTATYTNLPAGSYTFRVQGANSAGIWNREGLSIAIVVLPPPWLMWWAFCIYALIFLLALWSVHRIYQSYAIHRKAKQLANEMYEAEERADDDMQEQLELQDDIIKSSYQHNLRILSLVTDFVSGQDAKGNTHNSTEFVSVSQKRISALASLEDCLFYHAGGPAADLKKYTEIVLSDLLTRAPIDPDTIVTINEITATLVPAAVASPLSIVIHETLENCIQHAFDGSSPANYIQISLTSAPNEQRTGDSWTLTVRDSGMGIPEDIRNMEGGMAGLDIVENIVTKVNGSLRISNEGGTTVQVTLSFDTSLENPPR